MDRMSMSANSSLKLSWLKGLKTAIKSLEVLPEDGVAQDMVSLTISISRQNGACVTEDEPTHVTTTLCPWFMFCGVLTNVWCHVATITAS